MPPRSRSRAGRGLQACARPAMMFVAWPVSDACAIFLTGGQGVPVKYSVIATAGR